MVLSRRILIQLALFTTVALAAGLTMSLGYMRLPVLLFGMGHYEVRMELQQSAGLYPRGNVTYRGTEVGQVKSLQLTDSGVQVVLLLRSDIQIPSDLDAQVHSQNAIGEQYVALLPRDGGSVPLKDGDVIPADRTSVPPGFDTLLDATNRGLLAIPHDNLKTTVDEAYTAIGGLGPEMSRIVDGSAALATAARTNLDDLTNLIDNGGALLDTQTDTADSVRSAAAHLATITSALSSHDAAVRGILRDGPGAAQAARELIERVQPTLPVLLANLVSLGQVAVSYRADLEQLLVLLPQGVATMQAVGVANKDAKQDYQGAYLSFNLNVNLPPPCATGFLPAQQQRPPSDVDYPARPDGHLYCRVPQDAPFNVRGARNIPCETKPGKRAPSAAMCESDEDYRPLNDGFTWKGDPNATLSGQPIPQPDPVAKPTAEAPTAPVAVASYDPASGTYVGPDGSVRVQENLSRTAQPHTWQSMLIPSQ